MTPSGSAPDGKPVLSGVAAMSCTHGIPLEVTLAFFKDRGYVVDWPDYIRGCLTDGHKPATIRGRILAAVGDVHGPEYLAAFAPQLEAALGQAVA